MDYHTSLEVKRVFEDMKKIPDSVQYSESKQYKFDKGTIQLTCTNGKISAIIRYDTIRTVLNGVHNIWVMDFETQILSDNGAFEFRRY